MNWSLNNFIFNILWPICLGQSALKAENRKICDILSIDFFELERTGYLADVSVSNYDTKTDARPFDTINDILRCLSLVQSLLKGRNPPIWCWRAPTPMRLSGTDGLIYLWWHGMYLKNYYSLFYEKSQPTSVMFRKFRNPTVGLDQTRLSPWPAVTAGEIS